MKKIKGKYTNKIKEVNENNINHKLAKDKLEKRIKCELIIIKSCNSVDDRNLLEDNFFEEYGINKEVS